MWAVIQHENQASLLPPANRPSSQHQSQDKIWPCEELSYTLLLSGRIPCPSRVLCIQHQDPCQGHGMKPLGNKDDLFREAPGWYIPRRVVKLKESLLPTW